MFAIPVAIRSRAQAERGAGFGLDYDPEAGENDFEAPVGRGQQSIWENLGQSSALYIL